MPEPVLPDVAPETSWVTGLLALLSAIGGYLARRPKQASVPDDVASKLDQILRLLTTPHQITGLSPVDAIHEVARVLITQDPDGSRVSSVRGQMQQLLLTVQGTLASVQSLGEAVSDGMRHQAGTLDRLDTTLRELKDRIRDLSTAVASVHHRMELREKEQAEQGG